MTIRNTTPDDLDPDLFDKLRNLLARPDVVEYCRRNASGARHQTRRNYLQDTDLRSWRD